MKEKQLDSGITYWVEDRGKENSLMFLHSEFVNHEMFARQFEAFKDFNLIFVDLIGHGKSSKVKKSLLCDMSPHLKEIIDAEGIEKISILGEAIGGLIAQDFANKYAANISSLIVVGGEDIYNFEDNLDRANRKQQLSFLVKAMFSIKSFAKTFKKMSAYTLQAQEEVYRLALKFEKGAFKVFLSFKDIFKISKRSWNFPVLIVYGVHDLQKYADNAFEWKNRLLKGHVAMIPSAGHFANMDNAEEFNRKVESFLKREVMGLFPL